jgi:hypothetical protein
MKIKYLFLMIFSVISFHAASESDALERSHQCRIQLVKHFSTDDNGDKRIEIRVAGIISVVSVIFSADQPVQVIRNMDGSQWVNIPSLKNNRTFMQFFFKADDEIARLVDSDFKTLRKGLGLE